MNVIEAFRCHWEKKEHRVAIVAAFTVVAIALLAILNFANEPRVEIFPKNEYDKTLYVAADKNYAPYSYIDEKGNPAGRDVELAAELANRLEMNLSLSLMSDDEMREKFGANQIHAMMNVDAYLVANNPRIIATIPTTELQYVAYGKKQAKSAADLYGKSVVARHPMPGLGLGENMVYDTDYERMFFGMKRGEYDYVICPVQLGSTFLKSLNISAESGYMVTHVHSSIALHREDASLCMRMTTMLKRMEQEGRLRELDHKWVRENYGKVISPEVFFGYPIKQWVFFFGVFIFVATLITSLYQRRVILVGRNRMSKLESRLEDLEKERSQLLAKHNEIMAQRIVAEERSLEKTGFIFRLSHAIRTDMNGIMGYVELVKREAITEKARNFLEKSTVSGRRLLELMEDVLEMSRMENGKITLNPAPVSLLSILGEIEEVFAGKLTEKNIIFVISHTIDHPTVVLDAAYFQRALYNIMQNAYKFTPEFGRVLLSFKEIEAKEGAATYRISVKDNGIGMTEDFAQKIFMPFKSGSQGTGLGMAITKNIIDAMGGKLSVDTTLRQGTEFVIEITLPTAQSEDITPKIWEKDENMQGKKLLLAEDLEVNREIVKMLLEGAGFRVDTVTNGLEMLEKFEASKAGEYAAILADIEMPLMNGYDATKKIRSMEDPQKANIPIIAMTGNSTKEDVEATKKAGMNGHIAKPIDTEKMFDTLKALLTS